MKSAVLDQQAPKTYLLIFDPGEEVMKGLLGFVREQQIIAGHVRSEVRGPGSFPARFAIPHVKWSSSERCNS